MGNSGSSSKYEHPTTRLSGGSKPMNNLAPLGAEMPVWAKEDEGFHVPYWVFQREDVLEMENERLFQGETWNYMCLEAELQSPGDFVAVHVGETPVIVTRDHDG